jgi:hypothetical protein
VVTVATEPKTAFSGDYFARKLTCSKQAKAGIWEVLERESAGKCDRIWGLGFAAAQRAPKKALNLTMAAIEPQWTSVDTETRFFGRISRNFQRFR